MCYVLKMPDGSLVGGTKQDLNHAIQAKHSAEHKQNKAAGINYRCSLVRGHDPFSAAVPKKQKAQEEAEQNKLCWLIRQTLMPEIRDLRLLIKNQEKAAFLLRDQWTEERGNKDEEELHQAQVQFLKTMVERLKLPYDLMIIDIEHKYKSWGEKHLKILSCFSRRLRRALPRCAKYLNQRHRNQEIIPGDQERLDFSDDMHDTALESETEDYRLELYDEGLISVEELLGRNYN